MLILRRSQSYNVVILKVCELYCTVPLSSLTPVASFPVVYCKCINADLKKDVIASVYDTFGAPWVCKYFCNFWTNKMALLELSEIWGVMIHEKNL